MGRRINIETKRSKYKRRKEKMHRIKQKRENLRYNKRKTDIENAKKFVRNFSSKNLNEHEILVLSKGVKFIPTSKTKNWKRQLMQDFEEYARKMRCQFLFEKNSSQEIHTFYQPTKYAPHNSCDALENYLFATKYEISKIEQTKTRSNLSIPERNALKNLNSDPNIIIEKADKSSTLCLLNKRNYVLEGLRQLQNRTFYTEINKSNVKEITERVSNLIDKMYGDNMLDENTYRFITKDINKTDLGTFFLLPKIHKIPEETLKEIERNETLRNNYIIPGRPIVSLCGTPLHNLAHYIDHILVPVVQKQNTYLKDTKHFIKIIENMKIPKDTYLITADASNMYTMFEKNEILEATKRALSEVKSCNYKVPILPNEKILELLSIILEHTEFTFEDKTYKQLIGVPMGGACSAELADIRMFEILQNDILQKFIHKSNILLCKRYRDDIILLYKGNELEIHKLFEIANKSHKHLKFTYEINRNSIAFLDTLIYKGKRFETDSILDVRTYMKKTETYQYLERTSCHPSSCFKGFVRGESYRHLRNTNDIQVLTKSLNEFKTRLINRGYKENEIDEVLRETLTLNRNILLKDKDKTKKRTLVFITKYNPGLKHLKRILLKHWKELSENSRCKTIFTSKPMIAYKRNRNIREILKSKNR